MGFEKNSPLGAIKTYKSKKTARIGPVFKGLFGPLELLCD